MQQVAKCTFSGPTKKKGSVSPGPTKKENQIAQQHAETPHLSLTSPIVEGSLEVKLPTIWTDEKQSREEEERRERSEERRVEEKESEESRCRCAKR